MGYGIISLHRRYSSSSERCSTINSHSFTKLVLNYVNHGSLVSERNRDALSRRKYMTTCLLCRTRIHNKTSGHVFPTTYYVVLAYTIKHLVMSISHELLLFRWISFAS